MGHDGCSPSPLQGEVPSGGGGYCSAPEPSTRLRVSKSSSTLPVPSTTQESGSSAMCTGTSVSWLISSSRPCSKAPPPVTQSQPLPGAPAGDFESWQAQAIAQLAGVGVDVEASRWLTLRHGSDVAAIEALIGADARLAARIDAEVPFVYAEAVHAVRSEMAMSLEDVVRRRMPLTLLARGDAWRQPLLDTLAAHDALPPLP